MKTSRIIFLTLAIAFLSLADKGRASEKLFSCRDPEMGVRFKCSPNWQIMFDGNTDLFVIEEEPEVLLTIIREPSRLISLSELTTDRLQSFGHYADGFQRESILINEIPAVKVKAFDRASSDIRLTDIYLIRNGYLYKILFSVAPQNEWSKYQFVLQEVLKEFSFLPQEVLLSEE
ncbi:MAG: hypothetical protein AB1650_04290 [Candidatus Omnitrophota bacterium]